MAKAQTDIRTTSYDVATANVVGYQGSIADALKQIRAEKNVKPSINGRAELLKFLGVTDRSRPFSGTEVVLAHLPRKGPKRADDGTFPDGFFSLAYAIKRGWIVPKAA